MKFIGQIKAVNDYVCCYFIGKINAVYFHGSANMILSVAIREKNMNFIDSNYFLCLRREYSY